MTIISASKPIYAMTDAELYDARIHFAQKFKDAKTQHEGLISARKIAAICTEANSRGLPMPNSFDTIKVR